MAFYLICALFTLLAYARGSALAIRGPSDLVKRKVDIYRQPNLNIACMVAGRQYKGANYKEPTYCYSKEAFNIYCLPATGGNGIGSKVMAVCQETEMCVTMYNGQPVDPSGALAEGQFTRVQCLSYQDLEEQHLAGGKDTGYMSPSFQAAPNTTRMVGTVQLDGYTGNVNYTMRMHYGPNARDIMSLVGETVYTGSGSDGPMHIGLFTMTYPVNKPIWFLASIAFDNAHRWNLTASVYIAYTH